MHRQIIENLKDRGANWVNGPTAVAGITGDGDPQLALNHLVEGGVIERQFMNPFGGKALPSGPRVPMYRYNGSTAIMRRASFRVLG